MTKFITSSILLIKPRQQHLSLAPTAVQRREGSCRGRAQPRGRGSSRGLTCFDHNSSKSTNFSFGHRCLKHNSTRSRCWCKKKNVKCVFSCRNKPKLFMLVRYRGRILAESRTLARTERPNPTSDEKNESGRVS